MLENNSAEWYEDYCKEQEDTEYLWNKADEYNDEMRLNND